MLPGALEATNKARHSLPRVVRRRCGSWKDVGNQLPWPLTLSFIKEKEKSSCWKVRV